MLNNIIIESKKPKDKTYKVADARGLFLAVRPSGAKVWLYRFRIAKKESAFTIGPYGKGPHEFTIEAARAARNEAEKLVRAGKRPTDSRDAEYEKNVQNERETFGSVSRDWLESKRGTIEEHTWRQLDDALRQVSEVIGKTPIREVRAATVLEILTANKHRPHWAKIMRRTVAGTYAYAATAEITDHDPTYRLRKAIGKKGKEGVVIVVPKSKPNPHLVIDKIPPFLEALDASDGDYAAMMKIAIRLLMVTLVRPCELAGARWDEFDLTAKLWTIPAGRMKMDDPHFIPLSDQACELVERLRPFSGNTPYLFPERAKKKRKHQLDRQTKLPGCFRLFITKELGYVGKLTAHGLRGTAATYLRNLTRDGDDMSPRFDKDWVECQLSHVPRGVSAHYTHLSFMAQRTRMMQFYSDQVLPPKKPRKKTNVVELRSAA